jgi:predicted DNA-binding protein (MmcQ/YjbR family)
MPDTIQMRELALAMPGATEEPHFEKTSFRVNQKIFATMDEKQWVVCFMLSPEDQDLFCLHDKHAVYAAPNKWGDNGATYADLRRVKMEVLRELVKVAYAKASPVNKKKSSS